MKGDTRMNCLPGLFIIGRKILWLFRPGAFKKIFGYKLMKLKLMLVEAIAWLCSPRSFALTHKLVGGGGIQEYLHIRKPGSPTRPYQAHCLFATGGDNISMHAV